MFKTSAIHPPPNKLGGGLLAEDDKIGDVVLSSVKSRWIDAHKITQIDAQGRYLIANNKGFENGWTKKVFGRVISVNGQPFGRPTTKVPDNT